MSTNIIGNYFLISDNSNYLLPPVEENFKDKKCLVLDLDETLIHSSFKPVHDADFVVPVEIENFIHQVINFFWIDTKINIF